MPQCVCLKINPAVLGGGYRDANPPPKKKPSSSSSLPVCSVSKAVEVSPQPGHVLNGQLPAADEGRCVCACAFVPEISDASLLEDSQ